MTQQRILGRLGAANGVGVVRLEDSFDTSLEDLWSAVTDPERLRRWYGEVSGDLRPGGRIQLHIPAADIDAVGRIDVCEPPH
ncbi:MAG TPA: SRPBCC domain-containing protein, partial [Micromonosporaceae bacterium]